VLSIALNPITILESTTSCSKCQQLCGRDVAALRQWNEKLRKRRAEGQSFDAAIVSQSQSNPGLRRFHIQAQQSRINWTIMLLA
jgi:fructosamine-3-kinase